MINKLPAWVGFGAFIMAFSAGIINTFTITSVSHHAVTHQSGNFSFMVNELISGNTPFFLHYFLIIICFMAGCILSGYIIRGYQLKLGRRYGVSLLIECAMIGTAWFLYGPYHLLSLLLLAFASGLQNAMATTYSGAVIRTTHLTGVFTDISVMIGNRIAGQKIPLKKMQLLVGILIGFFNGSILAGILNPFIGKHILLMPVAISGATGLTYFINRKLGIIKQAKPEDGAH